jgi:hypothetical protein
VRVNRHLDGRRRDPASGRLVVDDANRSVGEHVDAIGLATNGNPAGVRVAWGTGRHHSAPSSSEPFAHVEAVGDLDFENALGNAPADN